MLAEDPQNRSGKSWEFAQATARRGPKPILTVETGLVILVEADLRPTKTELPLPQLAGYRAQGGAPGQS